MKKIIIINGANINLIGKREPEIYGTVSFEDYFKQLQKKYKDIQLEHFQSNIEGELIDKIQERGFDADGIVLNAGGYSHTSIALRDTITAVKVPVIEVHISNIYAREAFRHTSLLSVACKGVIVGLGLEGYDLAVSYFAK